MRKRRTASLAFAGVSMFALAAALPVVAAEVTPERLINANKEPHNWLINHRTYDAQRFSPLDAINEGNVKGLRLAYAVALGNSAGKEYNEATALAEDGFLYITDSWGVLYKIDVTSGDAGRIVWRMDPKQERQSANRGAAFWGNLVITPANAPARIIATDKNTGKIVWETNLSQDLAQLQITGAVLPIKDKIIVGASGGDRGIRDWIAALDAATGTQLWLKYTIPAPGEPGSETWKDKNNAWQTGGGAVWVTGSYDPPTNQNSVGYRQSGADDGCKRPARRQPVHQQLDLVGSGHRHDELALPVHAQRHVGLRRGGHPHPVRARGQWRAPPAHHPFRPQWLRLHNGASQRADRHGQALYRQHQLDQGY